MRGRDAPILLTAVLTAAAMSVPGGTATAAPPTLLTDRQVGAQVRPDLTWANRTPTGQIHVAKSGSNSNPGTAARPVQTIARALTLVVAGQAVVVHAGKYKERLTASKAGTATAPISLTAAPGERPAVVGVAGEGGGPFLRLNKPYWIVRGLEIDAGGAFAHAVRVDHTSHVLIEGIDAHSGTGPAGVVFWGARNAAVRNSRIHEYKWGSRDSHGVAVYPDSDNILVSGNDSWGNSGDSIQCAGVGETDGLGTVDPADLTIENNRYGNLHKDKTPREGDVENAVDIKSCHRVTIRGNKMMGYRGTSTSPQGTAIVAHFGADAVLIERNRIWDSNSAASLGSENNTGLGTVVFRRNLVFNLVEAGSLHGAFGVRVAPARVAEIYQNTFYGIPVGANPVRNYAIQVGHEARVERAVVINNIVDGAGTALRLGTVSDLTVDRNLAWRTALATPTGFAVGDPKWVADPKNNDFFTRPGSPARDAALPTGSAYCGKGPDLGFLETCN